MKKTFLTVFGLILLTASPQADVAHRRFLVPSGVIEYSITGNESGKAVVYFTDWGMIEARYASCQNPVFGQQNILTLAQKDWVLTIDVEKRVGRKIQNKHMSEYLKTPLSPGSTFDAVMMAKIRGEKIGSEKILNRWCEIWEIKDSGVRLWYWNWIPLKMVIDRQGYHVVIRAQTYNEQSEIPSSIFEVPPGIQFINQDIFHVLIS